LSFSDIPSSRGPWAFLLSVLLSATVVAGGIAILAGEGESAAELQIFAAAFGGATVLIGIAGAVLGLPLTWLLARHRLETPWAYPLAGFVAGAAIILLLAVALDGMNGAALHDGPQFLLAGAVPGCICGASWWWFYRRHGQDRDEA
jgi:membrane associated rhomboid family serine protease